MDRGTSSAFLTELLKSRSEPCYLLEFHFDDGVIRLADAWKNIQSALGSPAFYSGTAQAGTSSSLTLAADASAVNDTYAGTAVRIVGGTGAGQERNVVSSCKNELTYSQTLSNAVWNTHPTASGNSTITENATTAPDGTLTADMLSDNAVNSYHCTWNLASAQPSTQYFGAVHVKQGTARYCAVQIASDNASKRYAILLDLLTGTYISTNSTGSPTGTSYAIEDAGNGFWLVTLTIDSTSTGYCGIVVGISNSTTPAWSSSVPSYVGDGTLNIYVWGAQRTTKRSKYIHTEAATAVGVAVATPFNPLPDATSVYEFANYFTYNANGQFLSFSGLRETFDIQIPTVSISLSAVDQTWIAIALLKEYIDRPMTIYKAFIDYVNGVVTSPLIVFDGRLDSMAIADDPDGGTCTIAVSATNQWSDFERRPGRHTNPNEQQTFFPGDRFFEFAGPINKQIKWGAA